MELLIRELIACAALVAGFSPVSVSICRRTARTPISAARLSGRLVYRGSSLTFVGGPLSGRVGRDLRNDGFECGSVRCRVVSVE
jgi:hypothetical protein